MRLMISITAYLILTQAALSETNENLPGFGIKGCPALVGGAPYELSPQLGRVDFVKTFATADEDFARAAMKARNVASFYEDTPAYMSSGAASYDGVSKLDDISIGQMQWNWDGGIGTLPHEFMRGLSDSLIDLAPQNLRADLEAIKSYSLGQASTSDATNVINKWIGYADQENSPLHIWLNEPKVRLYQDRLVSDRMNDARTVAETWIRDRNYGAEAFQKTLILFANFNIHAGLQPSQENLRDVWSAQVDAFKLSFGNDRQRIFEFITDWMRSCRNSHADVRGKKDALGWGNGRTGNADIWSDHDFVDSLNEYQVDLFAYAFLFSTRSKKDDSGRRIAGWVQLDVLNRGGAVVLDKGIVRGIGFDWDRY